MKDKYIVAQELAVLKNSGEYILFNPEAIDPVYLSEGGDEALEVIERLKGRPFVPGPDSSICPPELFDFFREHNLIVPADFTPLDREYIGPDDQPERISLFLLLSQACNQACVYCFNGRETYGQDSGRMMSEDTAHRAVSMMLDRIRPGGTLSIVFFGGEPLLNWPLAKSVIKDCKKNLKPSYPDKTIRFDLTTNLTLFPDDLVQVCRENDVSVLVDVDGPADIHDLTRPFKGGRESLKTTVGNIERLAGAGAPVHLRATITSLNQDRMVEVAAFHKEIGGASSALLPLNPVDSDGLLLPLGLYPSPARYAQGLEEVFESGLWPLEGLFPFDEFAGRLKPGFFASQGCQAHSGVRPAVAVNGKIFSCLYLVNNPEYEVGDVGLDDFPRHESLKRMEKTVSMDNRPDCPDCAYRRLCGGGCPLGLLALAGNPDVPEEVTEYTMEINCAMAKTAISTLLWDMCRKAGTETIVSE